MLDTNRLELFVIDWDWWTNRKGVWTPMNSNKCNNTFFAKVLPGLRKFALLHDRRRVCLLLDAHFFFMVTKHRKILNKHCLVDFMDKCKHVDEAGKESNDSHGLCKKLLQCRFTAEKEETAPKRSAGSMLKEIRQLETKKKQ